MKAGYVYIMASGRKGTLYIGVTSNLLKRAWERRNGVVRGFTRKYGCKLLVWYAAYGDLQEARLRELSDVEQMNSKWDDLYPTLFEGSSRSLTAPLPSQGNSR